MLRFALAIIAVGLLMPSAASAWTPPGDRPANNALIAEVVPIVYRFWEDRDVHPCPRAQLDVRLASDLSDGLPWQKAFGRGQLGGCKVWFLTSLVANAQSHRAGNDWATYLCRTAMIEIGHTAGLDDDYGSESVMDPAADFVHGTPFVCRQWSADRRRAARRVKHPKSRSGTGHSRTA